MEELLALDFSPADVILYVISFAMAGVFSFRSFKSNFFKGLSLFMQTSVFIAKVARYYYKSDPHRKKEIDDFLDRALKKIHLQTWKEHTDTLPRTHTITHSKGSLLSSKQSEAIG